MTSSLHCILLLSLYFSFNALAADFTPADSFFKWLEANKNKFTQCEIQKTNTLYILCDNTKVEIATIKKCSA